jgi:hypothetical protein
MQHIRHITLTSLVMVMLAACGSSDQSEAPSERPEDVVFSVDPTLTGSIYENDAVGVRVRPPSQWTRLDDAQRDAVGESLATRQLESDYRLALQDTFVHPSSLSFLAVSLVQDEAGSLSEPDAYVEQLANQVAQEDDEIASYASFSVGGVHVHQFRFLREERINFTLIFTGSTGSVGQLDYSIPLQAYEVEGAKLESSIGSLQHSDQAE